MNYWTNTYKFKVDKKNLLKVVEQGMTLVKNKPLLYP